MCAMKTIVFTSINTAYLDKALALQASVKKHHPDVSFHAVLADFQAGNEYISDLFDHVEYLDSFLFSNDPGFLFQFNVVELCTLLKPLYSKQLVDRTDDTLIVYLDPDTYMFSPFHYLYEAHKESDVLLTPHLLSPPQETAHIIESEYSALQHGVFNLGFFSFLANENSQRFLSWWSARLLDVCSTVKENGLFTDQKVVDIAPIYFEFIGVIRKKGFNVATWNLFERDLLKTNQGFQVNQEPLVFYHFTGFDSGAGQSKVDKHFSDSGTLAALWRDYRKALKDCESKVVKPVVWSLDYYGDGEKITTDARVFYRYVSKPIAVWNNPYSDKFRQYWQTSISGRQFRQEKQLAGNYLQHINRFRVPERHVTDSLIADVLHNIEANKDARVYMWGLNEHARLLETALFKNNIEADRICVIDKSVSKFTERFFTDPSQVNFVFGDIIVICAIAAKQQMLESLEHLNLNNEVFSVS